VPPFDRAMKRRAHTEGSFRAGAGRRQQPELSNIVKTAIRIIAGCEKGEVGRAALAIGVSEPTLYRWRRVGNMREARGAEVLKMHQLTGLPMELLIKG
jgi:hypothetical protein